MAKLYFRYGAMNSGKSTALMQVAHNVEIGEHTVIAAQTGIAGSTKLGSHNMIGGQVGFAGHINVGSRNQIGAQSGIISNINEEGEVLFGTPALKHREFLRAYAVFRRNGRSGGKQD